MHKSLLDKPFVRRLEVVAAKLLFERSQAAVALVGKRADRYILEDMVLDGLLKTLAREVYIAEYLACKAAVLLSHDKVDQLGNLQILGRRVVAKDIFFDIMVDAGKEVANRVPRRVDDVRAVAALLAAVAIVDIQLVYYAQVVEYVRELFVCIIKYNLLKRACIFGYIFHIVAAGAKVEDIAATYFLARVSVIDILVSTQNIAYPMAIEILRLNASPKGLDVLHDHRLVGYDRRLLFYHNRVFLIDI